MRVSSHNDDPGQAEWMRLIGEGKTIFVFLDDVLLDECHVADEEEGFAVIARRDPRGNLVVKDDEVLTMKVVGDIRIELRDAA